MAFLSPPVKTDKIPDPNACPYLAVDRFGQPICEAQSAMEEYLPGLYPVRTGDTCLDTAGNWIDCHYFKRAKLL
ncbi:MAG: hypothetical protein EFT35_10390 [Methanophagales archaeon ANME-1-THS]|nr:MAG: hypothetical protein EFT35_10390 [Methanophagales archaeon ANME-1-THS]